MRLVEMDITEVGAHVGILGEVFSGRQLGVIVRRFYPAEFLPVVVKRLEESSFGLRKQLSDRFAGESYGKMLIVGGDDLREYFEEAAQLEKALPRLFEGGVDFSAHAQHVLSVLAGGFPVRAPEGPDGRSYLPFAIRGLRSGGGIDLHCENETVDFPAMKHLSQRLAVGNQASFYTLLASPESGGELVIYDLRNAEDAGAALSRMDRHPDRIGEFLASRDNLVPVLQAGDAILFDAGRHYHRVTPVSGQRMRWTMGSFLAFDRSRTVLHHWG